MTGPKTNERPGTKSVLRSYHMSATKARVVLDLIRGEEVAYAADILRSTEREAAGVILKVLNSAVANAVHNDHQDANELFVSACFADEGTTMKRWRPRARGRATRIRKRTCHITVIVSKLDEDRLERRRAIVAAQGQRRASRVAESRRRADLSGRATRRADEAAANAAAEAEAEAAAAAEAESMEATEVEMTEVEAPMAEVDAPATAPAVSWPWMIPLPGYRRFRPSFSMGKQASTVIFRLRSRPVTRKSEPWPCGAIPGSAIIAGSFSFKSGKPVTLWISVIRRLLKLLKSKPFMSVFARLFHNRSVAPSWNHWARIFHGLSTGPGKNGR